MKDEPDHYGAYEGYNDGYDEGVDRYLSGTGAEKMDKEEEPSAVLGR